MGTRIKENALYFTGGTSSNYFAKMVFKVKILKEETGGFWQNIPFPFDIKLRFLKRRDFKNGVQFRFDETAEMIWDPTPNKYIFNVWTSGQSDKSKEKRSNFEDEYDVNYYSDFISTNQDLRGKIFEYIIENYPDIDFTPRVNSGIVTFEGEWGDNSLPIGENYGFEENFYTINSITTEEEYTETVPLTLFGDLGISSDVEEEEDPIAVKTNLIEDPDETPSDFSSLQQEVCDSFLEVDEFETVTESRFCPTCIPNENFTPEKNWYEYEQDEVWLNERTCTYNIAVTYGETIAIGSENLTLSPQLYEALTPARKEPIVGKIIRDGIGKILSYRNKIITDLVICSNPPTDPLGECGPRIPQSILDTAASEQIVPSGQGDGTNISIFGVDVEQLQGIEVANPLALELYAKIKEYSSTVLTPISYDFTAEGLFHVTIPATLVDTLPDDVLAEMAEESQEVFGNVGNPNDTTFKGSRAKEYFKKKLPNAFKTFGEYQSYFFHTQRGRIKIDLDYVTETQNLVPFYASTYRNKFQDFYNDLKKLVEDNGYKITKYDNRARQAFEIKIKFKPPTDEKRFSIKTVAARYIGCPFKRCSIGLTRFINKYENEETLMGYVSKHQDMIAKMNGGIPPWLDFLSEQTSPAIQPVYGNPSNTIEAQGCLNDTPPTQAEILEDFILDLGMTFSDALEYSLNSLNCRTLEAYDPVDYQARLGQIVGSEFSEDAEIVKLLGDYKVFGQTLYGEGEDIVEQTKSVYKRIIKDKKTTEKKFFERLTGKTIQQFVKEISSNPKDSVGLLLAKINPCNWEALSIDIIRCMMKGLRPIDILKKAAKSLMGNLDPLEFEKIFIGLPADVQTEIEDEISAIVGDLPAPWTYAKQQEAIQKTKQTGNQYEDERNPVKNPPEPPQVTPTDVEALEDAEANTSQTKEDIKAQKAIINDTSYSEERFIEIQREMNELFDEQERYQQLADSGVGPTSSYQTKANDIENLKIMPLKEELETVQSDILKLAAARTLLSTLEVALTSASLAQVAALQVLAENSDPNVYEEAARKIIELIAAAYIDLIVDKLNIDELKELVNSLPGSDIFAPLIASAFCPHGELLNTWVDASFATLNIEPCKKPDWRIPAIPMIPEISFLAVLKPLLEQFLERMMQRGIAALVAFLMRTLQRTLDDLCDIMQGTGAFLAGTVDESGNNSLFDAIADAFCTPNQPGTSFSNSLAPDGLNSGLETFNDLFVQYGGRVPKETTTRWALQMGSKATVPMWHELFVSGNSTSGLLETAWTITQEYPDILAYIRTETDLENFFASITEGIDDDIKEDIENMLEALSNNNEIVEDVCKVFCEGLETGIRTGSEIPGYDGEIGPYYIRDWESILNGLLNGPEQDIIDAFNFDGENPFGSDPYCEDIKDFYNSENPTGNQPLLTEPQIVKDLRSDIAESIFGDLEISYVKDLIAGKDSYFNNLLADRDNKKLSRSSFFDPSHEFRVKGKYLFANAVNTQREHDNKWKTAKFPLRLIMRITDNLSDAVDKVREESEYPSSTGLGGKIKELIGDLFKPMTAFFELFKLSKPKPSNLFPTTIGKSYYDSLSSVQLVYSSSYEMFSNGTKTETEKKWIGLGFTSYNVQISTPLIKNSDVELEFSTKDGDYTVISGYSPHTVYSPQINKFYLDFRDTQKYSITVWDRTTAVPSLLGNSNEDGEVTTEPENGMKASVWKKMWDNITNTTQTVRTLQNNITIPYDIERYGGLYEQYIDLYIETNEETLLELKELNASTHTDVNIGPGQVPPNAFCLSRYMFDRIYGSLNTLHMRKAIGKIKTIPNNEGQETQTGRSGRITYDIIQEKLISKMINNILKQGESNYFSSNGIRYGYKKNSKIHFSDLLYVNPEANPEDPSSWVYSYDEEQKVLGKSATENSRVLFLDPDMYGGSYKEPKIYIKPAKHTGVLGLMQDFVPEDDGCEPKSESAMYLSDIKKRVKDLELKITPDKRLKYDPDCVTEPPYDLVSDASSHAYMHGVVILTVRVYIIEMILRCAPLFLQMPMNAENFDQGLFYFVIDNMEKGLKDTPSSVSFKKYSRETYWYLFLEQMVQTTEREILLGNIPKEPLENLFNQIVDIRNNYYQPVKSDRKLLKRIKRVKRNSDGEVDRIEMNFGVNLSSGDTHFNKLVDMVDAVSFNAFGKDFKQYLKNKRIKFNITFLTLKKIKRYCKIYAIYKSESLAKSVATYFIKSEFKKYMQLFKKNSSIDGEITSIIKYALNPKSGLAFGPRNTIGTNKVSGPVPNETYGDVLNIRRSYTSEEFFDIDNRGPEATGFLLQKYIVVNVKHDVDQLLYTFFGAYIGKRISIPVFQQLWETFQLDAEGYFDDDAHISDFFGNAIPNIDDESYAGSIGIKFGVQLSLVDENIRVGIPTTSETNIFESKQRGPIYIDGVLRNSIDLLSYEQDVLDMPIQKYIETKVPNENAGEFLKCYIDRMCELPEYRYIMEYLFPIKNVSSLLVSNTYHAYINSVGEHESERDPTALGADEDWKNEIMKNTKEKLRLLFTTYYNSKELDKEQGQRERPEKEFKRVSLPDLNWNIDFGSIRWWQKARFHDRPFNKLEQECMEGALGAFNQNLPEQQVAFSNNYDDDDPISPEEAQEVNTSPQAAYKKGAGSGGLEKAEPPQNYDPNGANEDNPLANAEREQADGSLLDQGRDVSGGRDPVGGSADVEFVADTEDDIF